LKDVGKIPHSGGFWSKNIPKIYGIAIVKGSQFCEMRNFLTLGYFLPALGDLG
jgi:hypothetical protein